MKPHENTMAPRVKSSPQSAPGSLRWPILLVIGTMVAAAEAAADEEKTPVRLETVVVTATRTGLAPTEPAASTTVLDKEDIAASANVAVDDVLRTIPGFSLYRRSSSMVTSPNSDPEAQGVTLRNIGPSGTSRALVMIDGVPLTDPFTGQVYWGKIDTASIDHIEVVRGGLANLWGNYSMAGAINIITRRPNETGASLQASGGNHGLTDDEVFLSYRRDKLLVHLEGVFFDTSGFPLVAIQERGPIDGNVSSRHEIFNGRVRYDLGDNAHIALHGQYFDEVYDGGTPLRKSDTQSGLIDLSGSVRTDDGSEWQAVVFSNLQDFSIHFSETDEDRVSEELSQKQEIPSKDVGGSVVWSKQLWPVLLANGGVDLHWIKGESRDQFFTEMTGEADGTPAEPGGTDDMEPLSRQLSKGEQFFAGFFLQGIYTPTPRWQITLAGRIDVWDNYHGEVSVEDEGGRDLTTFNAKTDVKFNPKLSVLYRAADWAHLRAAVYRAFRAPTLAELYRPSAVEGLELEPNPNLDAERLLGAEAGVDLPVTDRLDFRTTGFWSQIEDPITNVDVEFNEDGEPTKRMRQNLGLARTVGVEAEALYEILPGLQASASYLFSDGTLVRNPAERDLEGNDLPQVPKHSFTVGGRYSNPKWFTLAAEGRYVDHQFEDAENEERMGSYFIINASLSRELPWWNGEVFIAAENLLNRQYIVDVGGGVRKTGTPLLGHGGVRFRF